MPVRLLNWDEHRSVTAQRIQALRDFFVSTRSSLDAHERAVKTELDREFAEAEPKHDAVAGEPVDETQQVLFHYSPHFRRYYHEIPRLLHYSSVIQLYSLFEERGRALCDELRTRDGTIPLRVTDLADKGNFESIRLFITKLCHVDFGYWSDLHLLRRVRNRIVHHNGFVPDTSEHKNLESQLGQVPGIRIDADRFLLIFPEYVDHTLDRVTGFFNCVFEKRSFGDALHFMRDALCDHGAIIIERTNERTVVTLTSELTPRAEQIADGKTPEAPRSPH